MSGPLASLFSTIDSLKRGAGDAVRNPYQTLANFVNQKNQDAGSHLRNLQAAHGPGQPATPESQAALDKVVTALAEGYNPGGIMAGLASKTLPAKQLVEASQMARKGALPEEIWWKTGFGKGPDGQWRYEIDDSVMIPRTDVTSLADGSIVRAPKFGPYAKAGENVYHPELFDAYPNLDTISIKTLQDPVKAADSKTGGYVPGPREQGFKGGEIYGRAGSPSALKSLLSHELQHAVQVQQRWQPGGNPKMFMAPGEVFDTSNPAALAAFARYQRLAGEAEARLTESRINLTAQQRRDIFPWSPSTFQQGTQVPLNSLEFLEIPGLYK